MRRVLLCCCCLAVAFLPAACSSPARVARSDETEFSVTLPSSVAAGTRKIQVHNLGRMFHQYIVVRTDADGNLPTDAIGAVIEEQIPATDRIGEIPGIDPGAVRTLKVKLRPGTYVAFCNIVETNASRTSHYAEGMHTILTVTGN